MKRGQAAGVSGKEGLEQMRSRRRFYQVRAVGCYLPEMCQVFGHGFEGLDFLKRSVILEKKSVCLSSRESYFLTRCRLLL